MTFESEKGAANVLEAVLQFKEEPPKYIFEDESFDIEIAAIVSSATSERLEQEKSEGHGSRNCETMMLLKPSLCRYNSSQMAAASLATIEGSEGEPSKDSVQVEMNPAFITLNWDHVESESLQQHGRAQCKVSRCYDQEEDEEEEETRKGASRFAYCLRLQAVTGSNACLVGTTVLSRPFYIVDAKLSLDSPEWDDVWYKDMGGKEKSMRVTVSLVNAHGKAIKHRKIPLLFTLLYDDECKTPVSNQKIFRIMDDAVQHIDPRTGEIMVKFRIDDVSKNHQGQNFILEVAANGCPGIAPTHSKPVCIRSKKRKNFSTKRQKRNCDTSEHSLEGDGRTACDHLFGTVGTSNDIERLQGRMQSIMKWTDEMIRELESLKWTVIGYSKSHDGGIDYSRPFYNMINPNDKLDHILHMYSKDIERHLHEVAAALEMPSNAYSSVTSHHQSMNRDHNQSIHPTEQCTASHYSPDLKFHRSRTQSMWHDSSEKYPSDRVLPRLGSVVSPQGIHNSSRNDASPLSCPYEGHEIHGRKHHWSGNVCDTGLETPHYSTHGHDGSVFTCPSISQPTTHVFYILAKVFKSLKTDLNLGFPAYNEFKELVGFYKVSNDMNVKSGDFDPIERYHDEFGPVELRQASSILEDALSRQSKAVFVLEDWGSVSSMVEHALLTNLR